MSCDYCSERSNEDYPTDRCSKWCACVWTTRRRQNGGGGTGHGLCSVVVVRNRRAMQYYLWDDLDHTDHDDDTHIRLVHKYDRGDLDNNYP